jgi:PHD-finger
MCNCLQATITKHASPRHVSRGSATPTSSSGNITFKTNNVSQDSQLSTHSAFDERMFAELKTGPLRASTPTVVTKVPEELDDLGIQMVQDLLHQHHPNVSGLHYVGFGEFRGQQVPKFPSANGVPFVQILNVGDHWVCVTNILGTSTHDIYVFDSLQRKRLPDSAVVQISAILRDDATSETLTIHVRKYVRQAARSRACGLYAVAAAFACVNEEDPTGFHYDVTGLRESISERILSGSSDPLPGTRRWAFQDISLYKTRKVYCVCHKPWRSPNEMVQCSICSHWFHVKCVSNVLSSTVLQNTVVPWSGPCCEKSQVYAVEHVDD